jgi:hypothetical protein
MIGIANISPTAIITMKIVDNQGFQFISATMSEEDEEDSKRSEKVCSEKNGFL